MAHEAVLAFEYETEQTAVHIARAISPELGAIDDDRSRVESERQGATVRLVVEAHDLIALRAALNTWASLVAVAEQAGGISE